jgi:osmotically-inducible protein OsmY
MKKTFVLLAIGSVAFVTAEQNYPSYGNTGYNTDNGYYNDSDSRGYVDQGRPYQGQGSGPSYQVEVRRYDSQPQQEQGYNQQGSQNQGYYRQDRQTANRDSNSQRPLSDQELVKKIHDKLSSGWFSKGYQNVSYDVSNGNVALRGTVETINDKSKVEETVRGIEGVRQISNQITISAPASSRMDNAAYRNQADSSRDSSYYAEGDVNAPKKGTAQDYAATESDRQINAKIRDKLNGGWFSRGYDTVIIRTTNGVVVISGIVDEASEAQKISDNVKNVEGVKAVNNQLQVKK